MRRAPFVSILVLAAAALAAGRAAAQESEYPVSYVERPLTLPRLTLAPYGELDVNRLPTAAGIGVAPTGVVFAGMQLGATFGILNNLEVGAVLLPIQFTNPAGYGGPFLGEEGTLAYPSIYATFRFLHVGAVELGARLNVQFIVPRADLPAGGIVEPSLPLLVHIGKIARFDAEIGVPIVATGGVSTIGPTGMVTTTGGGAKVGLDVPLRFAVDIIEPLHLGLNTGLVIDDFGDPANTTRIPLGIFGGWAVGEKRPIVDIDPFLNFAYLVLPGVDGPGTSKVNPGFITAGINLRGYIYF